MENGSGRRTILTNWRQRRRQKGWKMKSIFNDLSRRLILPRLNSWSIGLRNLGRSSAVVYICFDVLRMEDCKIRYILKRYGELEVFFLCFDLTTLLLGSTAKSRAGNSGDWNVKYGLYFHPFYRLRCSFNGSPWTILTIMDRLKRNQEICIN